MPMYPEIMLIPMREELTRAGVEELRTAEAVDAALKNQAGTSMVIVRRSTVIAFFNTFSILGEPDSTPRNMYRLRSMRRAIPGLRRTGRRYKARSRPSNLTSDRSR